MIGGLRDPDDKTAVVRQRALGALMPALKKLARVARGLEQFKGDHQERACIALARLAPGLLAGTGVESNGTLGYHPSHTPQEAARLLAKIRAHEEAREQRDASDDNNHQLVEES
ncbi:MAG: hypothetical protein WBD40_16065 [Tepidisphaeraceae bacterium]